MSELPISEAAKRLSDLAHAVARRGEVVYLTEHGEAIAAIVPVDMAEDMEDDDEIGTAGAAAFVVLDEEGDV